MPRTRQLRSPYTPRLGCTLPYCLFKFEFVVLVVVEGNAKSPVQRPVERHLLCFTLLDSFLLREELLMAQEDEGSLYTSIGIAIAITGNVLISLALNIQKVAHNQLHRAKSSEHSSSSPNSLNSNNSSNRQPSDAIIINDESRPLLPRSSSSSLAAAPNTNAKKFWSLPKIATLHKSHSVTEDSYFSPQAANGDLEDDDELHEAQGTESDYLKSKLWYTPFRPLIQYLTFLTRWLGFCLMNVGETGNFLSYVTPRMSAPPN